jgi:hypothetical protein
VVVTGRLGPAVSCVQGVQLSDSGIFRFDVHRAVGETLCQLKVYGGAAAAQMPSFIWVPTTGKTIHLNRSCGDHTPRDEFKVEDIDALNRWSRQRRSADLGPRRNRQPKQFTRSSGKKFPHYIPVSGREVRCRATTIFGWLSLWGGRFSADLAAEYLRIFNDHACLFASSVRGTAPDSLNTHVLMALSWGKLSIQ